VRKLTLSSVLLLMERGSPWQVALALILSIGFHLLFCNCRPMLSPQAHTLQHFAYGVMTVNYFFGLLLKVEAIGGEGGDGSGGSGTLLVLVNVLPAFGFTLLIMTRVFREKQRGEGLAAAGGKGGAAGAPGAGGFGSGGSGGGAAGGGELHGAARIMHGLGIAGKGKGKGKAAARSGRRGTRNTSGGNSAGGGDGGGSGGGSDGWVHAGGQPQTRDHRGWTLYETNEEEEEEGEGGEAAGGAPVNPMHTKSTSSMDRLSMEQFRDLRKALTKSTTQEEGIKAVRSDVI